MGRCELKEFQLPVLSGHDELNECRASSEDRVSVVLEVLLPRVGGS